MTRLDTAALDNLEFVGVQKSGLKFHRNEFPLDAPKERIG